MASFQHCQTPQSLCLAGHRIEALSVGGIETCFQIPAYDVCLDIGRCPPGAERHSKLLLTHGHIDHAAGLPYYVSIRGHLGARPPDVYVPKASREALWQALSAWSALQSDTERLQLVGVGPGDSIPVKNAVARVFSTPHRITSVGYTLWSSKRRLSRALHGLTEAEIRARAERGETVHEVTETAEICFPGDTRIEVVEQEPSVTQARLLLLECTFAGPDVSQARAQTTGHIHLDQIAERASLFQNEAILLTHFSRRFAADQIRRWVDERLPASLRERVTLLLPPGS